MDFETINAGQDPDAANALIAEALAGSAPKVASTPPPPVQSPPDLTVDLLGGFEHPVTGETFKTAQVRELTGHDEEALARVSGNLAKTIETLLSRGVTHLGDVETTDALLSTLLAGDRDYLLLAIRCATFGRTVETKAKCQVCGTEQDVVINLQDDVPVVRLDNPSDAFWQVTLKSGRQASLRLPDGAAQKALAAATDRNAAAMNTLLLSKCLVEINNFPVVGLEQVRDLSMRDREELLVVISERNPGPDLEGITKPCVECSETMNLPLSLGAIFRF